MDCVACGHTWIEGMALPAVTGWRVSSGMAPDHLGFEVNPPLLLDAARAAQKQFQALRRVRRRKAVAWGTLAVLTLTPILVAGLFPEQVVAAIPVSIKVYDWMGRDVNVYGLEIRQVELQYLVVDGRKVIAVKGDVANVSSSIRKIPWLRFGLRSKDSAEVYHWTLNTETRPLKPGESTGFVTRLASPPDDVRNLEIRFARADEISSNTGP